MSWKTWLGNRVSQASWGMMYDGNFRPNPHRHTKFFVVVFTKKSRPARFSPSLGKHSIITYDFRIRRDYLGTSVYETRVASRSVYNTGVCCLVCDRSPVLTSGRETETATRLPTRPAKPSRATRLFDRQRSRCRPQGQRLPPLGGRRPVLSRQEEGGERGPVCTERESSAPMHVKTQGTLLLL